MSEKVIYTGHFVEDPIGLLAQIPPLIDAVGSRIRGHHVTNEFNPPSGAEGISLGKRRTLRATGEVIADRVHAVTVEAVDGDPISKNKYPHLTIVTAPGVSAVKSNEVIEAAYKAGTIRPIVPAIEFAAIEGYFNGEQDITS